MTQKKKTSIKTKINEEKGVLLLKLRNLIKKSQDFPHKQKLPCFAGMNKLKVYPLSPNLVLQKIVIHKSDVKLLDSYLGAPETFRIV